MEFVEPIRDKKKIAQIKNLLKGSERYRDLALFVLGINSALRVSDLLNLGIGDVFDDTGEIREQFTIRDKKTGKRNVVTINQSMTEALELYRDNCPAQDSDSYLFFSPKRKSQPITRQQAHKIISDLCANVGLHGDYGTHSLRKTWGYHARLNGVDLPMIMAKFNHSSQEMTKRYIGITDDELAEIALKLNL